MPEIRQELFVEAGLKVRFDWSRGLHIHSASLEGTTEGAKAGAAPA